MSDGTIRSMVKSRGFGLLETDRGEILPFDRSVTIEGGFDHLHPGMNVEFTRLRDGVTNIRPREAGAQTPQL